MLEPKWQRTGVKIMVLVVVAATTTKTTATATKAKAVWPNAVLMYTRPIQSTIGF